MIIGIEAERANTHQKTGVEHYAKQLILHLAKQDALNSYILYLRTKPEGWFLNLPKNFQVKVLPFPIFWTQLRLSWEMLWHPVDVLMIPASALPIIHPKKSVVTIHDVAWLFYPEAFTWFNRNFLRWSSGFAIKRAAKIIAVSEATKKDLIKYYNADSGKISVVHHGYEEQQAAASGQQLSGLPSRYVLFLSTLQPRKNLEGLISAFRHLKNENPDLPHKLVVAGRPGWKFESILRTIEANKDIVTYLNYVPDADRLVLLKNASALVLPSFYEGFGMQILEAFSQNVPVLTSNVSSMPEVAGEAAVYFDPNDLIDMKHAILKVLTDKSLSDGLKAKGQERLKSFSWDKCAKETLNTLLTIK